MMRCDVKDADNTLFLDQCGAEYWTSPNLKRLMKCTRLNGHFGSHHCHSYEDCLKIWDEEQ